MHCVGRGRSTPTQCRPSFHRRGITVDGVWHSSKPSKNPCCRCGSESGDNHRAVSSVSQRPVSVQKQVRTRSKLPVSADIPTQFYAKRSSDNYETEIENCWLFARLTRRIAHRGPPPWPRPCLLAPSFVKSLEILGSFSNLLLRSVGLSHQRYPDLVLRPSADAQAKKRQSPRPRNPERRHRRSLNKQYQYQCQCKCSPFVDCRRTPPTPPQN